MKPTLIEWLVVISILAILVALFAKSVGCQQLCVKSFGSTMTVNIENNKKLVNVTWKEDNLWILTRDARPGEKSERYSLKEKSPSGILQGEVRFVETINQTAEEQK